MEKVHLFDAIGCLVAHFKVPLEGAYAIMDDIHEEFKPMCMCAVNFISVNTLSYQAVCWCLFYAPDAAEGETRYGWLTLKLADQMLDILAVQFESLFLFQGLKIE